MKKSYLLFALPALALATSCASDSTVDAPDAPGINFNVAVAGSSRATATTTATISDFAVTAVNNVAPDYTYFKDFLHERKSENGPWMTNGTYPWPEGNLDFFAYSPAASVKSTSVIASGSNHVLRINDYNLGTNVATQADLLVAERVKANSSNCASGAYLTFEHALSQVKVEACHHNTKMRIEVYGVKIAYINSTGTFTYNYDPESRMRLTGSDADRFWTSLKSPKDLEINFDKPILVRGQSLKSDYSTTYVPLYNDETGSFFVIPQNLTASAWSQGARKDGAYIAIKCKIWFHRNDHIPAEEYNTLYWPDASYETGDWVCAPLNIDFKPGRSYTLRIDMTEGGLTQPTGSKGGQPIVKGKLRFDVQLADWANGGNSNATMGN